MVAHICAVLQLLLDNKVPVQYNTCIGTQQGNLMHLFLITYADGRTLEERGDSVNDVQAFVWRVYSSWGKIKSIVQTTPEWTE